MANVKSKPKGNSMKFGAGGGNGRLEKSGMAPAQTPKRGSKRASPRAKTEPMALMDGYGEE
jgi:hypothetical protein